MRLPHVTWVCGQGPYCLCWCTDSHKPSLHEFEAQTTAEKISQYKNDLLHIKCTILYLAGVFYKEYLLNRLRIFNIALNNILTSMLTRCWCGQMFLAGGKYSLAYNSIISSHEIQSSRSTSKADKTAVLHFIRHCLRFHVFQDTDWLQV